MTSLTGLEILEWRPIGFILNDFYLEIKHSSPRERVVFLVGPPAFLSLTWPTDVMDRETEPQQRAETVTR